MGNLYPSLLKNEWWLRMKKYIDEDGLPEVLNAAYTEYQLLGKYSRNDSTTIPDPENFTITFSESLNNFAMIFLAVRSGTYVMGSSFIPVEFFKSGLQYELNCINDKGDSYHGNLKYLTDTTASGKISGKTSGFEVYGFLRIV